MILTKKRENLTDRFQYLSFDIILGTIAIGYMATRILNVTANPYWWIILSLSVWVVYSADHIIDSYKNKGSGIIERHRYHYTHRKVIITAVVLLGLVGLTLSIIFLDRQILILGLILSIITIAYLILVYKLNKRKSIFLQKEFIIAAIYTSGIFLAPLVWHGHMPSSPVLLIIMNIFILAWFEGVMISWFDYDQDKHDGHTSFTVVVGKQNTQRFLILGHMLIETSIIVALIIIPFSLFFYALLILLFMNAFLGILILFPTSNISVNYHRLIGESVFLLPGFLVLI